MKMNRAALTKYCVFISCVLAASSSQVKAAAAEITVINQPLNSRALCSIKAPYTPKLVDFISSQDLWTLRRDSSARALPDLIVENTADRLKYSTISGPEHLIMDKEPIYWVEAGALTLAVEVGVYSNQGDQFLPGGIPTKPKSRQGQGIVRVGTQWYATELHFGVMYFDYGLELVQAVKLCHYFPMVLTESFGHSSTLMKIPRQNTLIQIHWNRPFDELKVWKIELLPNMIRLYTLAPKRWRYRFTTGSELLSHPEFKLPYFEATYIKTQRKPQKIKAVTLPILYKQFSFAEHRDGSYDAVIEITQNKISISKVNLKNAPKDVVTREIDDF